MIAIENNGFTKDEIINAITGRNPKYDFEYWAVDRNHLPIAQITTALPDNGISRSNDATRDTIQEFQIQFVKPTTWSFDEYAYAIIPYVKLYMGFNRGAGLWASWPQGLYHANSFTEETLSTGENICVFKGEDHTLLLTFETITPTVFIQGTPFTDALEAVVTAAGIPGPYNIVKRNDLTFPLAIEWPKKTSRLVIIKEICSNIGYFWYFNNLGQFVAEPWIDPALRPVAFEYNADTRSIIYTEASQENTGVLAPNHVEATVSRVETGETFFAFAQNTNENSKASVQNRGFIIPKFLENIDVRLVPDQPTLQAIVNQELMRSMQNSKIGLLRSQIVPWHGPEDTIRIYKPSTGWDGLFVQQRFQYNFRVNAPMVHTIQMIESMH